MLRLGLIITLATLGMLVTSCGATATPPPAPAPYTFRPGSARDFIKDGTWFRDTEGRYVLLRGVNFASRSKHPPYLPILPLSTTRVDAAEFDQELQAIEPELGRLHDMGMNVVRIPIMWKALEPTPNPTLDRLLPAAGPYLASLKKLIDTLYYLHGIFVILDFHQDIAHEVYGGDGFPNWALAIDDQHPLPNPPSDLRDTKWGSNYYDIPLIPDQVTCGCGGKAAEVRHTLQSFWNNLLYNSQQTEVERVIYTAQNPRSHLEKTIGQVAKYFMDVTQGGGHAGILGYELFNEPHPVGFGKRNFEENILKEFYTNALAEIRKYDAKSFVFVEPRMDWTTYDANGDEYQGLSYSLVHESFLPVPFLNSAEQRVVFSFHYYDPYLLTGFPPYVRNMHDKVREWPGVFQRLRAAAESRGLIPFLTEYGCSYDWTEATDLRPDIYQHRVVRACLDLQMQQIEAQVLNSTYWNYDLYETPEGKDNWNLENFSLLGVNRAPRDLDIMTRPYPARSSAKPRQISFDLATKNATIVLEGSSATAPTVVFVPRKVHFSGDDFDVRSTSSNVEWDEANQMLYWWPDPTKLQNQIIISPRNGFDSTVLPPESQALLPGTTFAMVLGATRRHPTPQ